LSLSTGLAAVAGVATTWLLLRRADATEFVASVVDELTKIHWPSRDETVNNTTIVVATTIFFATLLSVYDFAWARLTGFFLFSGS
jgi:preprotein translocase SecE subunit